jgi:soluble lytic murein transglycosylase-like protein
MSLPFAACMVAAAALYHLPPQVLPAIQSVEGGQVGTVHFNQNGSADLGPMQVNTIWIRPLAYYARMRQEVVVTRLINDPCFNIEAAAAIMRMYLAEAHGDIMTAVGFYHSHTPQEGAAYRQKVAAAAWALFGRRSQP